MLHERTITTIAIVHEFPDQDPAVSVYQVSHAQELSEADVKAAFLRAVADFNKRGIRVPEADTILGPPGYDWTPIDIINEELATFRDDLKAHGLEFRVE